VEKDNCTDSLCGSGSGEIALTGSLSGGGIIKEGNTFLIEATINGNTGVKGSLQVGCEGIDIHGTWNGISVTAVWDVYDGFIHIEGGLILVQPKILPLLKIPIPSI